MAVGHMISVGEALDAIVNAASAKMAERLALHAAIDCVLDEDVCSDVDIPQHDQSIVDGYAVRSADFSRRASREETENIELEIIEEVTAGCVPTCEVKTGQTVRLMTGVAIPRGADAVVMIEEVDTQPEQRLPLGVAHFSTSQVIAGQNVMPRGKSLVRGQLVLSAGTRLRPVEFGLLSQVGRTGVRAVPKPTLAVLPTGDELVDPSFQPGPGKIRNSNGPMLVACGRQLRLDVTDLGIGRDDPERLRQLIEQGLTADVLVVSGGVSAGTRDFVPHVLEGLGVRPIFHKVRVKPGKPLWFGRAENTRRTLVFGLPGNPVSSFVCFQLFVRPALKKLAGQTVDLSAALPSARLTEPFERVGDRAVYHPAQLTWSGEGPEIECIAWHGSGDLRALAEANALAIFPPSQIVYEAGSRVAYQPLD